LRGSLASVFVSFGGNASQPKDNAQAERQEGHRADDDGSLLSEDRKQQKGYENQKNSYLDVFVPGADLGEELFIFIHD